MDFIWILCHHKIRIKSTYLTEWIKHVLSFTPISGKREASVYLCPSEVVQAHLALSKGPYFVNRLFQVVQLDTSRDSTLRELASILESVFLLADHKAREAWDRETKVRCESLLVLQSWQKTRPRLAELRPHKDPQTQTTFAKKLFVKFWMYSAVWRFLPVKLFHILSWNKKLQWISLGFM